MELPGRDQEYDGKLESLHYEIQGFVVKPHLRTHNQWGWQGLKVIIANFEGRVIGQQIVVVVVEVQRVRGLSSKHAILRRSNYCPRDELIGDRKEGGDLQDLGQQMNHVGDSIRFFPLAAGSSCVTGSWSLCLFLCFSLKIESESVCHFRLVNPDLSKGYHWISAQLVAEFLASHQCVLIYGLLINFWIN